MKKCIISFFVCLVAGFAVAQAQLPAVTLKTIDGATVQTETLNNDGKPFIIDFFATWCKPCNRELSAIAEVYEHSRIILEATSNDLIGYQQAREDLIAENEVVAKTYQQLFK